MLKRIGWVLLALVLLLVLAFAINTWRGTSQQIKVAPLPAIDLDENAAAARLAAALQLQTVSSATDPQANAEQFKALHALLARLFPNVNAALQRENVGGFGLLYRWGGTDPKAAPILLLAHQDVAPVAPDADKNWQVPPFAGQIKDGIVWGRGAWDDKGNLMAQLEAIDRLIQKNYQPRRTVYLAYPADEETGGTRDGAQIAALLKQRGIQPAFVLEQGQPILDGVVPGVASPAALVGVGGNGSAAIAIKVRPPAPGTATASQPDASASDLLQRVIARLQAEPPAAPLDGIAGPTLKALVPEMHGAPRVLFANRWLFGSIVQRQLADAAPTRAWLRGAIPPAADPPGQAAVAASGDAAATLDFRILPGESAAHLLEEVRKVVAEVVPAGRFELAVLPPTRRPADAALTASAQYQILNRTIREVFPTAVVAPVLTTPDANSALGAVLGDHVFAFTPLQADRADLTRIHGSNGRLSVAGYANAVRFYHRLLSQLADASFSAGK